MVDFGLGGTGTIIVLIGLVLAVAGFAWAGFGRGPGKRTGVALGVIGAILFAGTIIAAPMLSTGNGTTPAAPPTAAINVVSATAPALPSGCTLYASQQYINCLVVYNKTSNYFGIQPSLADINGKGSGTAEAAYYLQVPFNMIRTDAINATYSFSSSVVSLPTANSLGSSPVTYSVVGYKAATSTSPGQWQVYPSQGTMASQYPTVSAPGTATNIESTGVPINAFGSKVNTWHFTLAGKNSTSAPVTFAEALTNYTAYPVVFSFANAGSTSSWTVDFTMIGWDP